MNILKCGEVCVCILVQDLEVSATPTSIHFFLLSYIFIDILVDICGYVSGCKSIMKSVLVYRCEWRPLKMLQNSTPYSSLIGLCVTYNPVSHIYSSDCCRYRYDRRLSSLGAGYSVQTAVAGCIVDRPRSRHLYKA